MKTDTYAEAMDWLFGATDYEKMRRVRYNADTFSLDRMRALLARLGSPQSGLAAVHVAGTKGKGSTAAMVHAIARAAGLRAGLYTSPHLVDIRERIRVDDADIAPADLAALVRDVRPHVEALRAAGDAPTFFEIFTALAFLHFARAGVDLAVVEVGLGGRLDATNVLTPHVAVVTAISMDHTAQLGGNLAAIAGEKAGIIKPGVPVVSQPQPPEAMAVIERACSDAGAPLVVVGRDVAYEWEPDEQDGRRGIHLVVRTPHAVYGSIFVPLMGGHQAVNAAAAVAAAEHVGPLAARLTPVVVRAGLRGLRWPGRMEILAGRPEVVADGAHNRASMERLMEALARHYPGRPAVIVFGSAADKDLGGMLDVLARVRPAGVVFTQSSNPRAADPADLAARYAACGGARATVAPEVSAALAAARAAAGKGGLVVVCGSLYLVGEAKARIEAAT